MITRLALQNKHHLTDEALAATYQNLFGLHVDLAGEDTVERQRVRRRAWEETRPFLAGEMGCGRVGGLRAGASVPTLSP